MKVRKAWPRVGIFAACAAFVSCVGALFAFQSAFREYPGVEYSDFPLPHDWNEKTEWVFARLMYPPARGGGGFRDPDGIGGFGGGGFGGGFMGGGGSDWTHGYSIWTQDYPRADRHFSEAVRRLTRVQVRSVEQPVNLDDGDDVFNWPWLYAVQVGRWNLTDAQAHKLHDYLMRGGFFWVDDFWGEREWGVFMNSMQRVFPDRQWVELPDTDPIFHTIYDLDDRYQVPGARYIYTGVTWKCQGCEAHWRGIYDDRGRVMVAISFNSDTGDSWEWADDPHYLEKFSALGIRIGVNYIAYAMTH